MQVSEDNLPELDPMLCRIPLSEELSRSNSEARILLVADLKEDLKRSLNQRWQVETRSNCAIALQSLQRDLPDLILIDLTLPELSGLHLLKMLRSNALFQPIPIILLVQTGATATLSGLAAGADDYLLHPISEVELLARVEIQLQKSQLRQEQSMHCFRSQFLMTVTHELQAPLVTILAWARLLQNQPFDPVRLSRALATIERNTLIEVKLVKDLLDVSSILAGTLQLKPQVVELVPLAQNVIASLQDSASAKDIQIIETIMPIPQGTILADGDRLRQILTNLVENAIKFTLPGGQVHFQLDRVGSSVEITVRDTGIGIRSEFLPFVFDRFTQAEVPSQHSPGGVGIGLAIVKHLVELHQGTIGVTSAGEEQGATFVVRLPLLAEVAHSL